MDGKLSLKGAWSESRDPFCFIFSQPYLRNWWS